MGHMEERSWKQTRKGRTKMLILGSIAVAGGLAIALVAPNVLGAMRRLGVLPKGRQAEHITVARKRLKKEGALVEEGAFLRLTPKGERQLQSLALSHASPAPQKKWDEKWRALIFDIPEKRRGIRNKIRDLLRSTGFVRMQHSVWLYPYPCEEFVALLKADMKIGNGMLYLIVESIENDQRFREIFGLSRSEFIPPKPIPLPKIVEVILDPILPRPDKVVRPH